MECPVCLDVYSTPLLLPGCGHSICQGCAETMVTADNYLRCPECRLMYQLRRGVASLPKNIALQRTIDEHQRSASRENLLACTTCEEHPGDAVSLYCKTCDKAICLKCYFSNSLRRGQTLHTGHQVVTSEDVLTKERRLLEDNYNSCLERRITECEYIEQLTETEARLKELQEKKLEEVEKNKNEIISHVKKTAAKLKFTLKGSIARDTEFLQMALQSAKERQSALDKLLEDTEVMREKACGEMADVQSIRSMREHLEVLPGLREEERPKPASFLSAQCFNTDLQQCLNDPNRALAYQTEAPRGAQIHTEGCVISDKAAYLSLQYNESVRVERLVVHYKEALYKGLSEKPWRIKEVTGMCKGKAAVCLHDLSKATMYKVYVTAVNDHGESGPSQEVMFRTTDAEVDIRTA